MTIFDPADPRARLRMFPLAPPKFSTPRAPAMAIQWSPRWRSRSVKTAARIGNAAGGIAVGKPGTAVVHARQLSAVLGGGKGAIPRS